jgi:hypothetical protein
MLPRRSAFLWELDSSFPKDDGYPVPVVHPFPLTAENREQVFLEPIFLLMYYLGFTYSEALNIPIVYKRWFIERVAKEIKGSAGDGEPGNGSSKAMNHQNDPMVAAATGRHRVQTPARLRRF